MLGEFLIGVEMLDWGVWDGRNTKRRGGWKKSFFPAPFSFRLIDGGIIL